jgi:hypothetical protein
MGREVWYAEYVGRPMGCPLFYAQKESAAPAAKNLPEKVK